MKKLLIVDDDSAVTNYLMVSFMQAGEYEPTVVNDSRTVPELLEEEQFDIMLLDMDMPHLSGMDLIRHVAERRLDMPIVVLTGVNDVDLAVESLKLGVFDYLTKPVDDEHLIDVIAKAISHGATRGSIRRLPPQLSLNDLTCREAFDHLRSGSPAMTRLLHQAAKMAAGDLCIFIFGERGTGKRSLAEAIHRASPRHAGPFVAVDASSHDMERFPKLLFGASREVEGEPNIRSFLEEADGGTLFINSVELLPLPIQVRLNAFIQHGEFHREYSPRVQSADARVIVASCQNLDREEYRESFSQDLLYHLMVNSLHIPPLRERREAIPLLANDVLQREAQRMGKPVEGFSDEVMELLLNYEFPGNVQELNDIVATCVINTESGGVVGVESLAHYMRDILTSGRAGLTDFHPRPLEAVLKEHVDRTLRYVGGDRVKAAAELGIDRETLEGYLERE